MEVTTRPVLNNDRALIFRATHRDNLSWILEHGLYSANSKVLDPNFKNIGNIDLISKRAKRRVTVGQGGTLSDYVPFYFTPFSIMMYNIHTGVNVKQIANEEIVILVSSLPRIAELAIPFVFTDQHAYPVAAQYFTELEDLNVIDWDLLNRRDFKHDPDDPGKKERYQAEALIWQHLPVAGMIGVGCFTDETQRNITAEIERRGLGLQARVQRNWYF